MADIPIPVLSSVPLSLASWIPGQTPMSTWPAVSTAILSYLAIVFGLQELMKDRPAFKLRTPFRIHNAFLSLSSLALLALTVQEVLRLWYTVGVFNALCATTSWTRGSSFAIWSIITSSTLNSWTLFLVLKKRPLSFLHVFHHSTTAILAFVHLGDNAWTVVSLNLGVHVVMYYYYFAAAGGAKPWWKEHLTTMQIPQFVIVITIWAFGDKMGTCAFFDRILRAGSFFLMTTPAFAPIIYDRSDLDPQSDSYRT